MSRCDARLDDHTRARLSQLATSYPIRTPSLWFDRTALLHNLQAVVSRFGDAQRWRPHIKTHKCADIVSMKMALGVRHFKCATLGEFQLLLDCARERSTPIDILFCYPLFGERWQIAQSMALEHAQAGVSWLIDSPDHLKTALSQRVVSNQPLRLAVDVDVGMQRSGSTVATWATFLANTYETLSAHNAQLAVLHGYEGHLEWGQQRQAFAAYDQLLELRALCLSLGATPELEIATSGSHSYVHALSHRGLAALHDHAKMSPGTVVLGDTRTSEAAADLGLHQAAFVASTVIHASPGRITLDAGSKAISPDIQHDVARVAGLHGWRSHAQNEEHLVLQNASDEPAPPQGALVWLVPSHVCTTVNLYRHAMLWSEDASVHRAPLARGHAWAEALSGFFD